MLHASAAGTQITPSWWAWAEQINVVHLLSLHLGRRQLKRSGSVMMMPEEAVAVLEEIPDDQNVQREDHEHQPRGILDKLVHLDRNEERRFANGQEIEWIRFHSVVFLTFFVTNKIQFESCLRQWVKT